MTGSPHTRSVLALLLGFVVLAGCTTPDDGLDAVPGWEEPGWMGQMRQQNEEFQNAMISCYAEYGLTGTRDMGGGVGLVNLADDSGQVPPDIQGLIEASAEDCNARVPLPEHAMNQTLDDTAYQRMLETRECVIARGFDVPAPPSAEAWKDSTPWYSAWNPYEYLIHEAPSVSEEDLYALANACPQPGPNRHVLAPTESR